MLLSILGISSNSEVDGSVERWVSEKEFLMLAHRNRINFRIVCIFKPYTGILVWLIFFHVIFFVIIGSIMSRMGKCCE